MRAAFSANPLKRMSEKRSETSVSDALAAAVRVITAATLAKVFLNILKAPQFECKKNPAVRRGSYHIT